MPRVIGWLSRWGDVLFLFAIAWCLMWAAVVGSSQVGLSVELGGFMAGLALAGAAAHYQITARVRPLRDFFLVLFFVSMGAAVNLRVVIGSWLPVVIFSGYVIGGNPLIMMGILGVLGYKKRTAFLAGVTMGQISEFSLVVVAAAVAAGQVGSPVLSLITLVGLVTMSTGSWMVTNSERIYKRIGSFLPNMGGRKKITDIADTDKKAEIVLFGHNRTGSSLRPVLERMGKKLIVVDFDPAVVEKLQNEGVEAIYGDLSDSEIYEEVGLADAELVISTVPDKNDSLQLLSYLRKRKSGGKRRRVVVVAVDGEDARQLREAGADYVLVPNLVGGEYLGHLLLRGEI